MIGVQIHQLQDFLFDPCIHIDYTIYIPTNNCRLYEIINNKYKIRGEHNKQDNIIGDMIIIESIYKNINVYTRWNEVNNPYVVKICLIVDLVSAVDQTQASRHLLADNSLNRTMNTEPLFELFHVPRRSDSKFPKMP